MTTKDELDAFLVENDLYLVEARIPRMGDMFSVFKRTSSGRFFQQVGMIVVDEELYQMGIPVFTYLHGELVDIVANANPQ